MGNYKGMDIKMLDTDATITKIGKLIRESGMTDKELADIMNLTPQSINKWRRGKGLPDIANLYTLGSILKVSMDEILVPKEAMKYLSFSDTVPSDEERMESLKRRIMEYYTLSKMIL